MPVPIRDDIDRAWQLLNNINYYDRVDLKQKEVEVTR